MNPAVLLGFVLGHVLGYMVVAFVLLPLYYRHGLTSIYGYLGHRLGSRSYRTGAACFIASRTLGATARLYLVVKVLQETLLDAFGLPFWLTAAVILLMVLLYTVEGGVRTIVFTDTRQTAGMLLGLGVCTWFLLGLFAFGVLTLRAVDDRWVPAVALCWLVDVNQRLIFGDWQVGLELLVLNGGLTMAGLWLVSRPAPLAVVQAGR
ncbi:MAG: hypothetical protein C0505_10280 [Leptothrix sp. (in: Bacteria)]|nr:hypothetical protein [Leptothrix sp. (in: b-proteobacteria)]